MLTETLEVRHTIYDIYVKDKETKLLVANEG